MKVPYAIVNAFTDRGEGGNPAGVVIDADHYTPAQKQAIAKQIGLSETAFVSRSAVADSKLDFFTPTRQIAHCGHATIATFRYLAQAGRVGQGWLTKETIDGNRQILLRGDEAFMQQLAPNFAELGPLQAQVLDSLGLDAEQLLAPPLRVNTGNSFVVLGLTSAQQLAQLRPHLDAVEAVSQALDLVGYYVFSTDSVRPGRQATARMFAPRYGIVEEAATGMAAGPLACYLAHQLRYSQTQFLIEQGQFMQPASPSIIQVQLERDAQGITNLMAGGSARVSRTGCVEI